jgi:hypothetical protein
LLAQHIQKQHQQRLKEENRGFTTKAMRDLERLRKTQVYSHSQLAIQFPDATLVKANFLVTETVGAVIQELKLHVLQLDHNSDSDANVDLELYQTPPRRLFKSNETLQSLGLVPAAKVYVSWKQPPPKPKNDKAVAWYIRPELLVISSDGPALPTAVPVVSAASMNESDDKELASATTATTAPKKKKTKAEKEANLLAKMMGK